MNMKTHNCSEERPAKVGTSPSVLIKRQHACKQEGHRDVKSSRNPGPEYLCETQTDSDIPLSPGTRNLKPRKRVTKYLTVTVKSLDQRQVHRLLISRQCSGHISNLCASERFPRAAKQEHSFTRAASSEARTRVNGID